MSARRFGSRAIAALAVGALVAGGIALSAPAGAAKNVKPRSGGYQYGNWSGVGAGFTGNNSNTVYRLLRTSDDTLMAVGTFRRSGDDTVNRVAKFNGTSWVNLAPDDSGISPSVPTTISAFGDWPSIFGAKLSGDDTLYAAGNFRYADDDTVNNVARWTGSSWKRMGKGLRLQSNDAPLQDIVVGNDPSHLHDTNYADDTIFAVGGITGICTDVNSCSPSGTPPYIGVAQWTDDTWSAVSPATFNSMVVTGAYLDDTAALGDDTLVVAGNFTRVIGTTDDSFHYLAAWSYTDDTWHHLGNNFGFNDDVLATTVHPTTGDLYVAGLFSALCSNASCTATTDISDGVAKWDRGDQQWYSVGSGMTSPNLDDIAFSPDGNVMYVSGFNNTTVSGTFTNGIAQLSGGNFSSAATDVGGSWNYIKSAGVIGVQSGAGGRSLVVNNDGSTYIGGTFSQAGPIAASGVALFTPGPEPSPYDPVFPAGVPTDVVATSGWNKVTVDWKAPTYTGSYPITNYLVQASPGGNVCITRLTDPKLNQCTYTNLTPGVQYTFRVQALNGAGWGDRSAASNVASPQNLKITNYKRTKLNFFLGGGSKVTVSGSAAGFPNGTRITPYLMWGNSGTWEEQRNSGLTAQGGRFSWERKFSKNNNGKTLSVKFMIAPNESNSVSMGPVR